MTDARAEDGSEPAVGELILPAGLRQDWPAPRVGVYGTRGGAMASAEAWLVQAMIGGASRLPRSLRNGLVTTLARLGRGFDRRHSDAAREFIRQALQVDDERVIEARVLDSWKHFLDVALDSAAFTRRIAPEDVLQHFDVELCDDARRVRAEKRGSILVTAHVGDWEAGAAAMPWLGFDPFYGVAKPAKNRPLSIRMQASRESRGLRVLPRRGAMQYAPSIIRAGGMLALILDQRARKRPVMANFFGRRACCDRGAGVLLKRLGAPIVFASCYRTSKPLHWKLAIDRVLWPEECEGRSVEEIVELVNRELERIILKAPEQYFWLHERYRGADGPTTEG